MQSWIFVVAVVVALNGLCSAHLCLLGPHQRGSMKNLNTPGSDDCILLTGPCGGREVQKPTTQWKNGGNYTVIFQKNLDHWTKAKPGYFDVNLLTGAGIVPLKQIPDNGEKSLHLYTASGPLPEVKPGVIIVQVMYVTNNPAAPPEFYQCADVYII